MALFFMELTMKTINLTQGQKALVDDEDYERINQYKWKAKWDKQTRSYYAHSTIRVNGKQKMISMHRTILNPPKDKFIDHMDHQTLNNCKSNLRICTNAENQQNRGKPRNNTSGVKGVYWDKDRNQWRAEITHQGKNLKLGRYNTIEEASLARENKEREFGWYRHKTKCVERERVQESLI